MTKSLSVESWPAQRQSLRQTECQLGSQQGASNPYLICGMGSATLRVEFTVFTSPGEEAVVQGGLAAGPGAADEPTEAEPASEPS